MLPAAILSPASSGAENPTDGREKVEKIMFKITEKISVRLINALSWRSYGAFMALLWRSLGTLMALSWHSHGALGHIHIGAFMASVLYQFYEFSRVCAGLMRLLLYVI